MSTYVYILSILCANSKKRDWNKTNLFFLFWFLPDVFMEVCSKMFCTYLYAEQRYFSYKSFFKTKEKIFWKIFTIDINRNKGGELHMRILTHENGFMSIKESAEFIGLSLSTFYTYVYRGFIKSYPHQTKTMIKKDDLMEFKNRIK